MRIRIYLAIIVLLALTSCRKEIDDGTFYISDQSKAFLTTTDSCVFISSDSANEVFTKTEDRTYFERYTSDTDGQLFTKYYYYQYFENIVMTYLSDNLTISYHLYIDQLGDGPREFMHIQISGSAGNAGVIINNDYGSPVYWFFPWIYCWSEIELNGITYEMVFKYSDGENDYYFQENKGLIGFTCNGALWSLVE